MKYSAYICKINENKQKDKQVITLQSRLLYIDNICLYQSELEYYMIMK